jgi:hypothetical protein
MLPAVTVSLPTTAGATMHRLNWLLEEWRDVATAREKLLANFESNVLQARRARADLHELGRRSRKQRDEATQRAEAPRSARPLATEGELAASAMQAALASYDAAFKAPSIHGLPSAAAIAAYMAILPEPEGVIRAKLQAALSLRRARCAGSALPN